MIVIILMLIELAKALAMGAVAGFVIYLLLRFLSPWQFWKDWARSIILMGVSFLVIFIWPFIDLKLRFDDWAKAEAEICNAHVSFTLSDKLPRERVAFYGKDITQYGGGSYFINGDADLLNSMNIDSLAVYDRGDRYIKSFGKKSLDGIYGAWKELRLEEPGHPDCKWFEKWGEENHNQYESVIRQQERYGIQKKCVAIRVIDDEESINFIAVKKKRRTVYRKPGFITDLVEVEVFNEGTGESYATLKKMESGWPRANRNFRTMFVGKGASCPMRDKLMNKNIGTSTLNTRIFTKRLNWHN